MLHQITGKLDNINTTENNIFACRTKMRKHKRNKIIWFAICAGFFFFFEGILVNVCLDAVVESLLLMYTWTICEKECHDVQIATLNSVASTCHLDTPAKQSLNSQNITHTWTDWGALVRKVFSWRPCSSCSLIHAAPQHRRNNRRLHTGRWKTYLDGCWCSQDISGRTCLGFYNFRGSFFSITRHGGNIVSSFVFKLPSCDILSSDLVCLTEVFQCQWPHYLNCTGL